MSATMSKTKWSVVLAVAALLLLLVVLPVSAAPALSSDVNSDSSSLDRACIDLACKSDPSINSFCGCNQLPYFKDLPK